MTGIVEGFRAALYGGQVELKTIVISIALTAILLVVSTYVFKRIDRIVVDFI